MGVVRTGHCYAFIRGRRRHRGLHLGLPGAGGSLAQLGALALASALTLLAAGLAAGRVCRQALAILHTRWNGHPLLPNERRT